MATVLDLFRKQVVEVPNKQALSAPDGSLAYRELDKLSDRLANELIRLELGPEPVIGILADSSLLMITAVLGALKSGGCYLPLDPSSPAERLQYIIRDAGLKAIVTTAGHAAKITDPDVTLIYFDTTEKTVNPVSIPVEPPGATPGQLAYVIYTSGSTGQPKGAMVGHQALMTMLEGYREMVFPDRDMKLLSVAPFSFDVSVLEIFISLCFGGTLFLSPPGSLVELNKTIDFIVANEINALYLPPVALQPFVRLIESGRNLLQLRWLLVGVEPIRQGLLAAIMKGIPGLIIINAYGPTETTVIATAHRFTGTASPDRRTPIGRPLKGYTVILVSDEFKPVKEGEEGQILIAGDGLARGYLHKPALTDTFFRTLPIGDQPPRRYYLTGDYGIYLENGEIEFIGRKDDQVKVRGYRIETGEIEAALLRHPFIENVAIIPVRKETEEKILVCFYTSRNHQPIENIREFLSTILPDYMLPSSFVHLENIPNTVRGKVDKRLLEQHYFSEVLPEKEKDLDDTIAGKLTRIYKEVLHVASLPSNRSLIDLGGDSISAMILLVRIEEEMGCRIPLELFTRNSSVDQLSQVVANFESGFQKNLPDLEGEATNGTPIPLSVSQQELWVLHELDQTGIRYNIVTRIRVTGKVDAQRLIGAVTKTFGLYDIFSMAMVTTEQGIVMQPMGNLNPAIVVTDLRGLSGNEQKESISDIESQAGRSPFRLSEPPLFRIDLVLVEEAISFLYLTVHHLIFDGWSLGILMRNILDFLGEIPVSPLDPGQIPGYPDYARWSRSMMDQGRWNGQLAFWKEKLKNIPPPLMLNRSKNLSGTKEKGSRYYWEIPERLTSDLRNFSKNNGLTRFSVLLSTYGLLLYLLTRRENIMIGTAYANRTLPKYQKIPGYFINMLAMIVTPDPDIRAVEYLRATGSFANDAFSNAQFPFGALVKELKFVNENDQPAFFEVMFIMQNWLEESYTSHGIRLEQQEIGNHTTKTDLLFNVTETGKICECWFEYPQALFTAREMERMATVFTDLLAGIISNPEKPLREISGHEALVPVAHFIGAGTLLISCCDHLLNNGWLVASVITSDDVTENYCRKSKIPVLPLSRGFERLRQEQQRCCLFSVNNDTIIPGSITGNPWLTAINYHNSLLPANAGLHAAHWALVNQAKVHGISWHRVTGTIDAGDLYFQKAFPVEADETAESLNLRCYEEAFNGFCRTILEIGRGEALPIPQELTGRSYHGLGDRPEIACLVDFTNPADDLAAWTNAMSCPNTVNEFGLPRLQFGERWYLLPFITKEEGFSEADPGTVMGIYPGKLVVATGAGTVSVHRILDKYGRSLSLDAWCSSHNITTGTKLPVRKVGEKEPIGLLNRKLIRNEPFWAGRLREHRPLRLPFVDPCKNPGENQGHDQFFVPFDEFKVFKTISKGGRQDLEQTILALVLLFVSKLVNQYEFEIPYGLKPSNLLPGSFFIPLRVKIDPDQTGFAAIASVMSQIEDQAQKGTFFADLFYRYPAIARKPAEEHFFSNQFFLSEEGPGDELKGFNDPYVGFFLNRAETCIEIRCSGSFPFREPAEFLANRLVRFTKTILGKDVKLRTTSLVTEAELTIITRELNNPADLSDSPTGFLTMFGENARDHPEQPAIRYNQQIITYRQLDFASGAIATMLLDGGFSSGDLAGVLLDRSPMLIAAMVGVLKAGGAFLPMDPEFPGERMDQISKAARLRWIITATGHRDSVPGTITHVLVPDGKLFDDHGQSNRAALAEPDSNAPAYVIFTSGTTGAPKGVLISHKALAYFIRSAVNHYGFTSGDRVLQFASIAFDTSIEEIFPALSCGACVVLRLPEMIGSAGYFLQMTSLWDITVLDLPTAYWHQLIRNMHEGRLTFPSCLRLVIIGGEKASPEIVKLWGEVTGGFPELINTYGPTETTVVSTLYKYDISVCMDDIPIGKPMESVRVWVSDTDLNPVLPYLPGELLIGGPQVSTGFLGEEDRYARSFIRLENSPYPNLLFFRSGDKVCYDENGLLYHLGRNDQQVKIRGFRVNPFEIDRLLLQLDGITGSVTVPYGEEDKKKLACYYTRKKAFHLTVNQARGFLASRLPEYMRPSYLAEVDAFPMTVSRKIDYRALPSPVEDVQQKTNWVSESETEKRLVELFRTVLPGVEIDPGSNFFSLGGDSLDAVNLLSGISREFGYDLPLRRFYELADLRAVAAELESKRLLSGHSGGSVSGFHPMGQRYISLLKTGGSQTPLFVVYGDRANHFLPDFIGHDRPLFTLLPQGSDGEAIASETVEATAALYLNEIAALFPGKPFHLAGFSFGGLIALEMALQLRDAGKEIGRVTVIDTAAPHLFRSIVHKVSWRKKMEGWMEWLVTKACLKTGKAIPPQYRNYYVLRSFRRAAYRYSPREPLPPFYFTIIRSARSVTNEPDLGWSRWKGFVPEITVIDGDHFSIVRNRELVQQYAGLLIE